jgi:molecular chaperone DnaJ
LDLYANLSISFAQALLGGKVQVPTLREKRAITLNECTQTNTTFRIRGEGIETKRNKGDLLITVDIELPKNLTKEQKDQIKKLNESLKPDQFINAKETMKNIKGDK